MVMRIVTTWKMIASSYRLACLVNGISTMILSKQKLRTSVLALHAYLLYLARSLSLYSSLNFFSSHNFDDDGDSAHRCRDVYLFHGILYYFLPIPHFQFTPHHPILDCVLKLRIHVWIVSVMRPKKRTIEKGEINTHTHTHSGSIEYNRIE